MLEPGTQNPLDYERYPKVKNPDGSFSNVVTASFNIDGKEVLLPTMIGGRRVTAQQAIENYKKTGDHFGIFDSPQSAQAFATNLEASMQQPVARRNPNPMVADKTGSADVPLSETISSMGRSGANTLTFGLADRLVGQLPGHTTEGERERTRTEASRSPVASTAASIGGAVVGGNAALRAAGAIPGAGAVLNPVPGQFVGNFFRYAAPGAALGGAQAAGEGEDIATGAALGGAGAAGAAGLVKGVTAAARGLQGLVRPDRAAARAVSRRVDTPALAASENELRTTTGHDVALAEASDFKARGELRRLAADNPTIGEAAARLEEARTLAPAERSLSASARRSAPKDLNSLLTQQKERMTAAMTPIRTAEIPIAQDEAMLFLDPRARAATNADPQLRSKLAGLANRETTHLSVDDFDNLRLSLRGRQASYANPQSSNHNPHVARKYGELADQITAIATRNVPEYGAALKQFARDSDYITGFRFGRGGKAVADASEPSVIRTLDTPEGKLGYATGSADYRASKNLSEVAPRSARTGERPDAVNITHALAAASAQSRPGVVYHVLRAIPGLKMSERVQRKVAEMLFDPNQAQNAINALRLAGATDQAIRQLTQTIAAGAGQAAGGLE
jgi:hypothetical protein